MRGHKHASLDITKWVLKHITSKHSDQHAHMRIPITVCIIYKFITVQRVRKMQKQEGKPTDMTQLSPRSHPRHLMGKRTAQKDAIKDITSDSQVMSYFPYSWSPASLTINIYFYLFLYLYITRITINNGTLHLKSLRSQNRRAAFGRPAIKLLGASTSLQSTNPRP